ncbi:unnamed protein product [Rotaria sordida]|uniref:F-box domain-containing protein n=1 Tax=Rotaria sordida TaxID=392033 RepID=A0A815FNR2_9BILA|nr:unnamed protein product [Rotaria sordida]
MKYSFVQLMDLPVEILMIIFKKLNNDEVLYSLKDINMRLDQIIGDPIFTNEISLIKYNSLANRTSALPDIVLDRFYFQILPKICHKIKCFTLETLSIERILLAAEYCNLNQLNIFCMNEEIDIQLFTDKSRLLHIFQKQIVTLCVNGRRVPSDKYSEMYTLANIFSNILLNFTNLLHLKFYSLYDYNGAYLSFDHQSPMFFSSTLVELHINVYYFDDCLYLLDGRLHQLHTLFVKVFHILSFFHSPGIKEEKLLNLKCFSLICFNDSDIYDEAIVPHLHRMINLEKLLLYLVISCNRTFIDGNNLKKNIINHLPLLRQFIFNIHTTFSFDNEMHFLSNEDIQDTFTDFKDYEIISSVDYFPNDRSGQSHIYTYPYTLRHYNNITNNFPRRLFNYVQEVTLFDERPFEHEFFMRLVQAFPFLKNLTITNTEPQKYKQYSNSNDENQDFPIIKYPHLIYLNLFEIHDDYAEQFLFDTKTCFLNDIRLLIDDDVIQRVTQNFTRDATRNNYSKVKTVYRYQSVDLSKYC